MNIKRMTNDRQFVVEPAGPRRTAFVPVAGSVLEGRYACKNCAAKFMFQPSAAHVPVCPECKSSNVIITSPLARAVFQPVELTKAQIKRSRYIQRNFRQVVEFDRFKNGFMAFFERLELPAAARQNFEAWFETTMKELERVHTERLTEYDAAKQGEPDGKAS